MNRKNRLYGMLALFLMLYPCLHGNATPLDILRSKLELSITVVDEDGRPLPGSNVTASFRHTHQQKETLGVSVKRFEKIYEGEEAIVFSYSSARNVAVWAEKEGYWVSGLRHKFPQIDRVGEERKFGNRYQKSLTIILRKKENPRPLYAQATQYHSTRNFGVPLRYDLEAGDLVAPQGKGKTADIVFTLVQEEGEAPGVYENKLAVTFSHPDDGIIQVKKGPASKSKLLLGATAPQHGYVRHLEFRRGVEKIGRELYYTFTPSKEDLEQVDGYWIRVRSKRDPATGELKEARYGKISGPIQFRSDEEGGAFFFTYFLSPDASRSLEWNGESLVPRANLQGVDKH